MLNNNLAIIILAAGRGKRLGGGDKPKVLHEIGGKPILSYILQELNDNGVEGRRIFLVIGFGGSLVKKRFGNSYNYALQEDLLGTAHAAKCGLDKCGNQFEHVMIMNGDDSAFYKYSSLKDFTKKHLNNNNDISLLTCQTDPEGLGRVIRAKNGKVVAIVEKENLKPEQKQIKEISTGVFCFKKDWFYQYYPTLEKISGLEEYGLPSFVGKAIDNKAKFEACQLKDFREWHGINTQKQLEEAHQRKVFDKLKY